jgi:hypothetical protein
MIKIGRPNIADAPSWYPHFFNLTSGDDLIEVMESNKRQALDLAGRSLFRQKILNTPKVNGP